MGIIKDEDKKTLTELFKQLEGPVKLIMFTQEMECEYCSTTREMAEDIVGLSPKLELEIKDFVKDAELAGEYGVDKIPALLLIGDRDYGIRFYGIPAGYEFTTLIEDIMDVSRRDPGLSEGVLAELDKIDKPIHLQAMVTPTCPYCPKAVRAAHRFAMASEYVRSDMVEVSEFPHLAVKYRVQGVPQTVINEEHFAMGALPEKKLAKEILEALAK